MKRLHYAALVITCIILCFIVLLTWSNRRIEASDLIIKVDKNSLVKISESDVLSYFDKNSDSFKAISEYMLKNEAVFKNRPATINKEIGIPEIQDDRIKKLADKLLQDGLINAVTCWNDNIADIQFHILTEYKVYQQGIRYVGDKNVIAEDKTEYNHIKEYKDLGDGWFYYIYYFDKIKDADVYRKKAWDSLSEVSRKSITDDWSKAIVQIKDVDIKTEKIKGRRLVVSVTFNTDLDGLLGPIVAYFDPKTKEIIGGAPRL